MKRERERERLAAKQKARAEVQRKLAEKEAKDLMWEIASRFRLPLADELEVEERITDSFNLAWDIHVCKSYSCECTEPKRVLVAARLAGVSERKLLTGR